MKVSCLKFNGTSIRKKKEREISLASYREARSECVWDPGCPELERRCDPDSSHEVFIPEKRKRSFRIMKLPLRSFDNMNIFVGNILYGRGQ